MANVKNGSSKQRVKKILASLAVLAVMALVLKFLGIPVVDTLFPSLNEGTQQTENNQPQQPTQIVETPEGTLILTMIDCGQADSFLLQQGEFVALVDCGTRSTGDDVVDYLKSIGITKIDLLFGTHPHDDHMGGMYDVITNFEIGKIITPKIKVGEVTTNWYLKLMEEISTKKHTVEYPSVNDVYHLGDATMTVIGPLSDPDDNLNNYSIVLKVTYGNMDVIMTGDAEKEVEADIIASGVNLDAEILKVGHHGSNTSSTEEFLDAIDPDYALISCKVGNKHDHPTAGTMEKLEERDIEVYRTDESGTVIVTITANDVTFNTDPDDYRSGIELAGGS